MIISHKHKFIFLKPYKVAGSSFEFALSSVLGPKDLVTYLGPEEEKRRLKEFGVKESHNRKPVFDLMKNFQKQNKRDLKSLRWPKLFHPHASAREVQDFLGEAVWEKIYQDKHCKKSLGLFAVVFLLEPAGRKSNDF